MPDVIARRFNGWIVGVAVMMIKSITRCTMVFDEVAQKDHNGRGGV